MSYVQNYSTIVKEGKTFDKIPIIKVSGKKNIGNIIFLIINIKKRCAWKSIEK